MNLQNKHYIISCLTQVECLSNITRQKLHKDEQISEELKKIESYYIKIKEILESEEKVLT